MNPTILRSELVNLFHNRVAWASFAHPTLNVRALLAHVRPAWHALR
jgi:hypothetical protein